jgi:hypothetical protein
VVIDRGEVLRAKPPDYSELWQKEGVELERA